MTTVLVLHASAHGSTTEIAEGVSSRLRADGLVVTCAAVADDPDPRPYDAVVVGSAIHDQAWLPAAADYLGTHAEALRERPVWLFSVGMPGALPGPLRGAAAREGPAVVAGFEDLVHPRGTLLLTGVVRREHFPRTGRLALRLAGVRFGDFRDWGAVNAWASGISRVLREAVPTP